MPIPLLARLAEVQEILKIVPKYCVRFKGEFERYMHQKEMLWMEDYQKTENHF